jgi:hypothetical protein
VPLAGVVGGLHIKTKIYYQSVPPKWVQSMFTLNTYPINRFKAMYQSADQSPILIASDSLNGIDLPLGIKSNQYAEATVFPTISMDGKVYISSEYGSLINSIEIYNGNGKLVNRIINGSYQTDFTINLPAVSGVYYIRLYINNKVLYKKVVKS